MIANKAPHKYPCVINLYSPLTDDGGSNRFTAALCLRSCRNVLSIIPAAALPILTYTKGKT